MRLHARALPALVAAWYLGLLLSGLWPDAWRAPAGALALALSTGLFFRPQRAAVLLLAAALDHVGQSTRVRPWLHLCQQAATDLPARKPPTVVDVAIVACMITRTHFVTRMATVVILLSPRHTLEQERDVSPIGSCVVTRSHDPEPAIWRGNQGKASIP